MNLAASASPLPGPRRHHDRIPTRGAVRTGRVLTRFGLARHSALAELGNYPRCRANLLLVTFAEVAPRNAAIRRHHRPGVCNPYSDWLPKREGELLPLRTTFDTLRRTPTKTPRDACSSSISTLSGGTIGALAFVAEAAAREFAGDQRGAGRASRSSWSTPWPRCTMTSEIVDRDGLAPLSGWGSARRQDRRSYRGSSAPDGVTLRSGWSWPLYAVAHVRARFIESPTEDSCLATCRGKTREWRGNETAAE